MELYQAVQMIESVANGINPENGEAFPADSPYNSPSIIRALFTCTQHIKHAPAKNKKTAEEKQAENKSKGLPKNTGLPWTKEVKAELASLYKAGRNPANLAQKFERSKYAILLELKKQGLISEEDAVNMK